MNNQESSQKLPAEGFHLRSRARDSRGRLLSSSPSGTLGPPSQSDLKPLILGSFPLPAWCMDSLRVSLNCVPLFLTSPPNSLS